MAISAPQSVVKHPFYNYTLDEARRLGAGLCSRVPLDPHPPAVSDEKALAAVMEEARTCGFNWITGRVAWQLLRAEVTGKPEFTS